MDIRTRREFARTNEQDDPHMFAKPPNGFQLLYGGGLASLHARWPSVVDDDEGEQNVPRRSGIVWWQDLKNVADRGREYKTLAARVPPVPVVRCDACGASDVQSGRVLGDWDVCSTCLEATFASVPACLLPGKPE